MFLHITDISRLQREKKCRSRDPCFSKKKTCIQYDEVLQSTSAATTTPDAVTGLFESINHQDREIHASYSDTFDSCVQDRTGLQVKRFRIKHQTV